MAGKIEHHSDQQSSLDYTLIPVPENERMGKMSLTMAWWALCSAMFWLIVPATLAMTLGTVNVLIGLGLSAIVYSLINAVLTRFAIKTGLSVSQFSRIIFGRVGSAFATLIFFATAIYYCVFEGSVIAVAISAYFPDVGLNWAYLIVIAYSVPLVFGSVQHWLDKFNGVLLPFYIIGLIVAVILAISEYGYSSAWLELGPEVGPPENGWFQCFTFFMGVWIMMMYTFDFARLGKKEDETYHAKINFGWVFYTFTFLVNAVVGIFIAATIPLEGGITEISAVLGLLQLMGFFGLVFVWVSQTRINTANFYLAAVNMQAFFQSSIGLKWPKMVWAAIVGAIVYWLMLKDVFSFILEALAYQGTFVVGWVVIALVHICLNRDENHSEAMWKQKLLNAKSFHGPALVSWLFASAVGVFFLQGSYAMWSAPITAVLGAVMYALLMPRSKTVDEQLADALR